MGYDWPEELRPPSYFWGGPAALGRAYYSPDMAAVRLALGYVRDIFGVDGLKSLIAIGLPIMITHWEDS